MRIDSHQHFWRYDPQQYDWITEEMRVLRRDFLPADLLLELRASEMDGSVAVQARQSLEETEFLLELAAKHDHIKAVVGWVDLQSPDVAESLHRFSRSKKFRGVRHVVQGEPDDRFMLRPEFCRGIGCLKDYGLTYDILIYARQLPAASELVARFPEQPFVIDHIAKPGIKAREIRLWAEQMRAIAQSPSVFCKVSGMVTEADWKNWKDEDILPYLDVVLEAFGPERLMFGSDWPVCLVAASYGRVKSLIEAYTDKLSPHQREAIFGGNAAKFYGLV
jgi:L-fuconolactonase